MGAEPHTEYMTTTVTPFEGVALSLGEYQATVEKIAKVNERAVKRGFTGRLEVVAQREERTEVNPLTQIETTKVVYVTRVEGQAPSYGGWTFLARTDRVGDSFTIATAPGVDHVERDLVRPGECDHCGFDRRRNNTYLVRNDVTGETINVGSTCIKDFLGWNASVVFFTVNDTDLEVVQGGSFIPEYSVDTVLALAYAAIRAYGWVPSSSYDATPTREYVSLALSNGRLTERERAMVAGLRAYAQEAMDKVEDIKAFLLSDEFSGTSTYVDNLKVLAAADTVTYRQFGLLASAPQAYLRHQGQVAERAAQPVSEFVGQVKDKVEVKGTIKATNYIQGVHGTTLLYTIQGEDGNLYKWFSSNWALGEEVGTEVHIKGTVKAHDEFKGTKSTVLTRCKAV